MFSKSYIIPIEYSEWKYQHSKNLMKIPFAKNDSLQYFNLIHKKNPLFFYIKEKKYCCGPYFILKLKRDNKLLIIKLDKKRSFKFGIKIAPIKKIKPLDPTKTEKIIKKFLLKAHHSDKVVNVTLSKNENTIDVSILSDIHIPFPYQLKIERNESQEQYILKLQEKIEKNLTHNFLDNIPSLIEQLSYEIRKYFFPVFKRTSSFPSLNMILLVPPDLQNIFFESCCISSPFSELHCARGMYYPSLYRRKYYLPGIPEIIFCEQTSELKNSCKEIKTIYQNLKNTGNVKLQLYHKEQVEIKSKDFSSPVILHYTGHFPSEIQSSKKNEFVSLVQRSYLTVFSSCGDIKYTNKLVDLFHEAGSCFIYFPLKVPDFNYGQIWTDFYRLILKGYSIGHAVKIIKNTYKAKYFWIVLLRFFGNPNEKLVYG